MRTLPLLLLFGCAFGGSPPDTDEDSDADADTDSDADTDTDTDTDADTDADADVDLCDALPSGSGAITDVAPGDDVVAIVAAAAEGATIRFAAGTYALGGKTIVVATPGITLRSAGDSAATVILDGERAGGSIVEVYADDVTIAHLTVANAYNHGIHVMGTADGDTTGTLVHDVRVIDAGQQAIKINADGSGAHFADDGEISCSHLELTDAGRPFVRDFCYTGGVDAHRARGWTVRDSLIRGFWCAEGLSEHGVHFWTGSRDTVIERNRLEDNARGIGLGLGQSGVGRTYADDPCPGADYVGHFGGIVRNNVVFVSDPDVFASGAGWDTGIALEQACGASVVHNTVYGDTAPFSSIEWRFSASNPLVSNNLTSHAMQERDDATSTGAGNASGASALQFVDLEAGDLHLSATASVVNKGVGLDGLCEDDIDGDPRDSRPDIGADEVSN